MSDEFTHADKTLKDHIKYDARIEDEVLYNIAIDYLHRSRGAVQRIARESVGLEPLMTDVEVQQTYEQIVQTLDNTVKLGNHILKSESEQIKQNKWFFILGGVLFGAMAVIVEVTKYVL